MRTPADVACGGAKLAVMIVVASGGHSAAPADQFFLTSILSDRIEDPGGAEPGDTEPMATDKAASPRDAIGVDPVAGVAERIANRADQSKLIGSGRVRNEQGRIVHCSGLALDAGERIRQHRRRLFNGNGFVPI